MLLDRNTSLPLRECGLKLMGVSTDDGIPMSLPLRECGLKYVYHWQLPRVGIGHSPCGSVD